MNEGTELQWLGAAFGMMGPGWQGSFRIPTAGDIRTVVVTLDEAEVRAVCEHLGQTKLEKRQAELILQHGGRELIDAALNAFEAPDEVQIHTDAATRSDDLRRWHVLR